jgi:hypothetical protein
MSNNKFIASFDIGKCNFAFYIEEFDEESLKKIKTIPKLKRYNPDGTPTEEFTNVMSSVYLNGNKVLYQNLDLTKGTNKDKYLDKKIFVNMITELDKYKDYFDKCSTIVIEQQMSFKAAQNTMAIKLGQHCYSYFLFRYGDSKEIVEFPAYYKTQILGAPRKLTKPQRKKWATEKAVDILMERGDMDTLDEIVSQKKKDDLADVLIQLQSFKFLRYIEQNL